MSVAVAPQDVVISPYQQLQENPTLKKCFAIAKMPRLGEYLEHKEGEVEATFTLQRNDEGISLHVQASCVLSIECQRCLQAMDYPVALDHAVLLVPPGFNDQDFDGEYTIVDENRLSLLNFLEDELILALPLIARHDSEHCYAAPKNEPEPEAKTYKPFANLKELRGKIRD